VIESFHATFLCVGGLSMVAAFIFFQLGPREQPSIQPTVVDEG
jgi:predicted MFS family arabinose efflux permease